MMLFLVVLPMEGLNMKWAELLALKKLKSNHNAVRAYCFNTFWQDSETQKKNCIPPAGICEPIVASELPIESHKVFSVSPLAHLKSLSPVHVSSSAPAKESATGACYAELQSFWDDLQLCLNICSDDLLKAKKEKRTAVGNCRSL
jgi:hypothetical protein